MKDDDRCQGRAKGTRNESARRSGRPRREKRRSVVAAGLRPETGGTRSDKTGNGQMRAVGQSDSLSTNVRGFQVSAVGSADKSRLDTTTRVTPARLLRQRGKGRRRVGSNRGQGISQWQIRGGYTSTVIIETGTVMCQKLGSLR